MSKQTPKKREPTLRELLERDAKFPLRTIGITDEFDKTPIENGMSDTQDDKTVDALLQRAKQGYADFQKRQVPLGPPSEFDPRFRVPQSITTNPGRLLFDILTMAGPLGERADTERARIRELDQNRFNMRTNYGQNTPKEVFGMTALGNGPSYPRQSKMSKAMGVTNQKAGSK